MLTVVDGRVALQLPPGEGISLSPNESDWLALALQAAAIKARTPLV